MNQRVLLLLHALTAVVATGSVGHIAALGLMRLTGREVAHSRLKLHALLSLAGLTATSVLGLVTYPHYRIFVRGLVLDRDLPWASTLFELKENFAAFTLPLVLVVWALERDREAPRASAGFAVLSGALIVFVLVSGLLVTMVRGP